MLWLSCSSRLHFISEIITLLFRIYNLKRLNKYQQSSTCRLLIFMIRLKLASLNKFLRLG